MNNKFFIDFFTINKFKKYETLKFLYWMYLFKKNEVKSIKQLKTHELFIPVF